MTDHSRQALVGAIGGTYISLAVTDIDELTIANFALLNSADFDNPMQAVERYLKLDGRFGILEAFCNESDASMLTAGLGTVWEIERLCIKPYALHVTAQASVQYSTRRSRSASGTRNQWSG